MIKSGLAATRAGDRRRDLLAHPRLDRPRHLRAVRRRRRRAGAQGRARARARRTTAASSPPTCIPTAASTTCSTSTAGRPRPAPPACCAWTARRSSSTRWSSSPRSAARRSSSAGLDHRRHRLAGAAPGEPAHHDGDRPQARPADGAGGGDRARSTATPRPPRFRWRSSVAVTRRPHQAGRSAAAWRRSAAAWPGAPRSSAGRKPPLIQNSSNRERTDGDSSTAAILLILTGFLSKSKP